MSASPPHPPQSRAGPAHNIPQPLTRFIGREREIADGQARLARSRLVTITGPGGAGKTRLAREIALRIADAAEYPVWWVELAPITDPGLVPQIVATVLGLREAQGQDWVEALVAELKPRKLLLVLDGCEHLIEAVARLVGSLLRACPELRCLAASQEPLGIIGESVLSTPPMGLPDPRRVPGLDELKEYEALRLFADRAATALPGFALDAHNAPLIAQICARLDGIPLAIELAASRVRLLTVEQIAARLDDRFRLLTHGSRTAPPRHQTLRAAIEWSYGLLAPAEQTALRRAAVFANRFDLDAAETVLADDGTGDGVSLAGDDILDLLARLVDKSLIVARQGDASEKEFHLLDSIRHYLLEQWRQPALRGEADAARRRHFTHYLGLAQAAERQLNGPDQARWLKRVEIEADNFRAALAWGHDTQGMGRPALELAATLAMFAYRRGAFTEAREQVTLALSRWAAQDAGRAKALQWGGVLADQQGDTAAARAMLDESLTLYQSLNDRAGTAGVLNNLGRLAGRRGDYPTARALHEASLVLRRELGAERDSAITLSNLGYIALAQGDYDAANQFYQQSLILHRKLGDGWGAANALLGLGEIARCRDRYLEAGQAYEDALRQFRDVGDLGGIAMAQHNLGYVALHAGHVEQAGRAFQASLSASVELRQTDMIAFCLAGLAAVFAAAGDLERGARLFGAADALLQAYGVALAPADRLAHDRHLAALRGKMGDAAADALAAAGRDLSLDQVVALALAAGASAAGQGGLAPPSDEIVAANTGAGVNRLAPPSLRLAALGAMRVTRDGAPLTPAEGLSAKARELLFYVASHPPRSMLQIGADLWPEASKQQLRTAFHNTLHNLRHALGGRDWVMTSADGYTLNRDLAYWYDVEQFRRLAGTARSSPSDAETQAQLRAALDLYGGDFLAELDADWVTPLRSELQRAYGDTALALGRLLMDDAFYGQAADVYRALIARDGHLEAAYRELMRCLSRSGERAQALRVYQTLASALERDMGVAPAAETRALFERIRQGEDI